VEALGFDGRTLRILRAGCCATRPLSDELDDEVEAVLESADCWRHFGCAGGA
jgi:hypothetical protein